MSSIASIGPDPQRLQALARANSVRLARADLKRRIAAGQASAAEVIRSAPHEAERWPVGDLLISQRHWGVTRCRKFLQRNQINELKAIGELTGRQRELLASQLESADRRHLVVA